MQTTMSLNPLANPKGVKFLCELCQKPAYFQCLKCRYTYYCTEEHLEEDWLSIHQKICSVITYIRSPQPHAKSEEERQQISQQLLLKKQRIISLALEEGERFLCEAKPQFAIPAALQALKVLTDIHGSTDVKLTPAYLILAEAAIELGSVREASQYLCQAQWSVLKASKEVGPLIKSLLHRNLGQLAAAKGNWEEARRHFGEDVYQATVASNPEAVETAGGYYHMAAVFLKENKLDVALSLHQKVVSIWCRHFKMLLCSLEEVLAVHLATGHMEQQHLLGLSQHTLNPSISLITTHRAQASSMLHGIRRARDMDHGPFLASVYFCLATLYTLTKEHDKSNEYGQLAISLLTSQEEETSTEESIVEEVRHLMKINSELRSYNW